MPHDSKLDIAAFVDRQRYGARFPWANIYQGNPQNALPPNLINDGEGNPVNGIWYPAVNTRYDVRLLGYENGMFDANNPNQPTYNQRSVYYNCIAWSLGIHQWIQPTPVGPFGNLYTMQDIASVNGWFTYMRDSTQNYLNRNPILGAAAAVRYLRINNDRSLGISSDNNNWQPYVPRENEIALYYNAIGYNNVGLTHAARCFDINRVYGDNIGSFPNGANDLPINYQIVNGAVAYQPNLKWTSKMGRNTLIAHHDVGFVGEDHSINQILNNWNHDGYGYVAFAIVFFP